MCVNIALEEVPRSSTCPREETPFLPGDARSPRRKKTEEDPRPRGIRRRREKRGRLRRRETPRKVARRSREDFFLRRRARSGFLPRETRTRGRVRRWRTLRNATTAACSPAREVALPPAVRATTHRFTFYGGKYRNGGRPRAARTNSNARLSKMKKPGRTFLEVRSD